MTPRFPFPGLPAGWYVVALSQEIPRGKVLGRHYFEQDLVLYRSESGVLRVADAFCPHMGAHLGKVGVVEGDLLRCGFHGFRYDHGGRCVATAYGGPPPARARLRLWELREQNGMVLVWYDPLGRPPAWEVPRLDDDRWTPMRWHRFSIATHPQETTENSVDFGHFTSVHGFVDGSITRRLELDGPDLSISYRVHRPLGVPGLPPYKLPVDYDVKVSGLGYSQVDARVPALGFELRIWILPVPIDEEHIDLVVGVSLPAQLGPLSTFLRWIAHRKVCGEVEQDLDVWSYKAFVSQPAMAKGDGPIAEYRRWVTQFYAPYGETSPVERS